MALVICCVFLTDLIRRRMSRRLGINFYAVAGAAAGALAALTGGADDADFSFQAYWKSFNT